MASSTCATRVAVVRGAVHVGGVRERVERGANRAVADRVRVHLPPGRVERRDPRVRDLGVEVRRTPGVAGLPVRVLIRPGVLAVRLQQRGRLGGELDHAVEEHLHRRGGEEPAHVRRPHGLERTEERRRVLEILRRDRQCELSARGQPAGVPERRRSGQVVLAGAGVHERRDADAVHATQGRAQRAGVLLHGRGGDQVRDETDRRVLEQSRWLPGRIADDRPVRWVGRRRGDAGDLERPRVRERGVSVEGVDEDRPCRVERVEVGLRGDGARRLDRLVVPVVDLQPAVRLLLLRLRQADRDAVAHLVDRQLAVLQAALPEGLASGERMHVRVLDARHDGSTLEVDHLRARPDQILRARVRADVDDEVVADRDAGRGLVPCVDREDGPVAEHEARIGRSGERSLDRGRAHHARGCKRAAAAQELSACGHAPPWSDWRPTLAQAFVRP